MHPLPTESAPLQRSHESDLMFDLGDLDLTPSIPAIPSFFAPFEKVQPPHQPLASDDQLGPIGSPIEHGWVEYDDRSMEEIVQPEEHFPLFEFPDCLGSIDSDDESLLSYSTDPFATSSHPSSADASLIDDTEFAMTDSVPSAEIEKEEEPIAADMPPAATRKSKRKRTERIVLHQESGSDTEEESTADDASSSSDFEGSAEESETDDEPYHPHAAASVPQAAGRFAFPAGRPLEQLPGRSRCSCKQCHTSDDGQSRKRAKREDATARRRSHAHQHIVDIVARTLQPYLNRAPTMLPACYNLPDAELVYCLHHRIMRDQLTQEALKLVLGCAAGKLSTMLRLTSTPRRPTAGVKKGGKKVKLPPTTISPSLRLRIQQLCWAMDMYFHAQVTQRFAIVRASMAAATAAQQQADTHGAMSPAADDSAFQSWSESEVLGLCRTKVHQHLFYARSTKKAGVELHLSPCDTMLVKPGTPAPRHCTYCLESSASQHHDHAVPASGSPARIFGTYVARSQGRIQYSELAAWLSHPCAGTVLADRDRLHALEMTLVAWLVERGLMTIHLTHKQRQVARSKELDALPIDQLRRMKHATTVEAQD